VKQPHKTVPLSAHLWVIGPAVEERVDRASLTVRRDEQRAQRVLTAGRAQRSGQSERTRAKNQGKKHWHTHKTQPNTHTHTHTHTRSHFEEGDGVAECSRAAAQYAVHEHVDAIEVRLGRVWCMDKT
jgi:hypothetical protein